MPSSSLVIDANSRSWSHRSASSRSSSSRCMSTRRCRPHRLPRSVSSVVHVLFVALLQQISSRSSLRDLECILQRFGLRASERLLVVLDCTATCPKSLKKAATRLCARHAVFYYSVERPLCAVAHALAGIELETMDFVLVVRNVLPDADIIDRVVDAVAGSNTIQLFRIVPPSSVGFA